MPLQIARLVERLSTLSTIEDWSVAVHSLHVSLHVSELSECLIANFTRMIFLSGLIVLKTGFSSSDRVVFLVFELNVPPQQKAESKRLVAKWTRMGVLVVLVAA